jgi:NosR/NirI family nitrous oxide reductase transcriptional regulator
VYCECLCPFGAAQDVLKIAGGAKYTPKKRLLIALRWMQRLLALAGILAGLLFRNPAHLNYEVFGTFFTLTGTVFQFALLGVVLIASLFLLRPWCNFLCPIRAVSDYLRMWRNWGKGVGKNVKA